MGTNISKNTLFPGLFIMLGLIFLGIFIKSAVISFKSYERVVKVKGLAQIEVPANKVIWPVVYKEIGNDLSTLYKAINHKNQVIISYLKSKGLEENEIYVSAPSIIDMNAERYQSQPSKYRYNITSVITVTSNKVELVSKIISSQSELLKKGVALLAGDYQYQTQYLYTLLNQIKPSMIEEATKNARASAQKFAKDSNSKLGKIKTASQGQFSIYDRDANTPQIKTVRVVSTIEYMLRD
ncbi:MAG: SIMPL domain-containing protein [Bacteroidales bacterium]|nr:SIMPL domain-containing protein [Bacteroidales bacterium]MDD4656099.1 SIMPL domain-containing protein [Bacteroidales bacterium]